MVAAAAWLCGGKVIAPVSFQLPSLPHAWASNVTDALWAARVLKEGRFTHPWQPARLIEWNSVWVGQCDISAKTSRQGRL